MDLNGPDPGMLTVAQCTRWSYITKNCPAPNAQCLPPLKVTLQTLASIHPNPCFPPGHTAKPYFFSLPCREVRPVIRLGSDVDRRDVHRVQAWPSRNLPFSPHSWSTYQARLSIRGSSKALRHGKGTRGKEPRSRTTV